MSSTPPTPPARLTGVRRPSGTRSTGTRSPTPPTSADPAGSGRSSSPPRTPPHRTLSDQQLTAPGRTAVAQPPPAPIVGEHTLPSGAVVTFADPEDLTG